MYHRRRERRCPWAWGSQLPQHEVHWPSSADSASTQARQREARTEVGFFFKRFGFRFADTTATWTATLVLPGSWWTCELTATWTSCSRPIMFRLKPLNKCRVRLLRRRASLPRNSTFLSPAEWACYLVFFAICFIEIKIAQINQSHIQTNTFFFKIK